MNAAWESIREFLNHRFMDVPLHQWAIFLAVTAAIFLVLRVATSIAHTRLEKTAGRTAHNYDDYLVSLLKRTRWFGLLGVAIFLALYSAVINGGASTEASLRSLALVLIYLQIGYWGSSVIDVVLARGFRRAGFSEGTLRSSAGVVRWFGLVFVWGIVALLILTAFNIEITPLIAGLGVGGIAVAFALQQILSDLFCSVAIVLDRPFEVGDFIITGDYMGSVEFIGIKTTRLRSLGGEQIIIANSDLLGSRIRNYKRMEQRRIVFGFGVVYSTESAKLERIPAMVQKIVSEIENTRFDRAHFQLFGDSALQYEVCYYVLSADYNLYMDIQQSINMRLLQEFRTAGIEMAYPSRTLYFDPASAALVGGVSKSP